MAKIDLDKWICSWIEACPDFKERGKIPSMYKQVLKDQGLEYKDGQIVEIKQELNETKPKHLFLKKDMSFDEGKLYRCKIKSKDKIAYVDLEEVKSNPKEVEYSTMLQSIWGKICELEGKLGDIYKVISKPHQDIPQPAAYPRLQCWFPDGTCMNPYRDCVNCPRPNSTGNRSFTSTTTSINPNKVMYDGIPINDQEKKD